MTFWVGHVASRQPAFHGGLCQIKFSTFTSGSIMPAKPLMAILLSMPNVNAWKIQTMLEPKSLCISGLQPVTWQAPFLGRKIYVIKTLQETLEPHWNANVTCWVPDISFRFLINWQARPSGLLWMRSNKLISHLFTWPRLKKARSSIGAAVGSGLTRPLLTFLWKFPPPHHCRSFSPPLWLVTPTNRCFPLLWLVTPHNMDADPLLVTHPHISFPPLASYLPHGCYPSSALLPTPTDVIPPLTCYPSPVVDGDGGSEGPWAYLGQISSFFYFAASMKMLCTVGSPRGSASSRHLVTYLSCVNLLAFMKCS